MRFIPSSIARYFNRAYRKLECREHQLLYLFLEITRRCNLECRHCGSDCHAQTSSCELTLESWLQILEDIALSFRPPPVIVLTGGEPLLFPDLPQLLRKITNLGVRWGMVSNGYALTPPVLETLVSNTIHSLTLSLDGLQEHHNWLRQRSDAFKKTLRALQLVSASTIPVKDVVTCVYPKNLHHLDALAELLLSHAIPSWRLFRIFPAGRAQGNAELLLSPEQTREMIEWVMAHKKSLLKKGLVVNLSCEGWLPWHIDRQVRDAPFFCRSGVNIASILCDGTITGCPNNSTRFFEGNILHENFGYVWQNGFTQFRTRSWIRYTSCRACVYVDDCQGSSIHLWQHSQYTPDFCYMECFDTQRFRGKNDQRKTVTG
jgi:radical SAM protein with 4Fe4S-binding SPASM domain